jgi:hypothetical protein
VADSDRAKVLRIRRLEVPEGSVLDAIERYEEAALGIFHSRK